MIWLDFFSTGFYIEIRIACNWDERLQKFYKKDRPKIKLKSFSLQTKTWVAITVAVKKEKTLNYE